MAKRCSFRPIVDKHDFVGLNAMKGSRYGSSKKSPSFNIQEKAGNPFCVKIVVESLAGSDQAGAFIPEQRGVDFIFCHA